MIFRSLHEYIMPHRSVRKTHIIMSGVERSPLERAYDELASYECLFPKLMVDTSTCKGEAQKKQDELRAKVLSELKMPSLLLKNREVKQAFDDLAAIEIKLVDGKFTGLAEARLCHQRDKLRDILDTTCNVELASDVYAEPGPVHKRAREMRKEEEEAGAGGSRDFVDLTQDDD